MTTDPQRLNAGELVDKARDLAREHPEQARAAIDKAQDLIDERTGGRFGSAIESGGDAVEDQLGIPQTEQQDPPAPSPQPGPESEPSQQPDDAPSTQPGPEPKPDEGPEQHPAPDTDPQTRPADPPPGGPMEPGQGQLPG